MLVGSLLLAVQLIHGIASPVAEASLCSPETFDSFHVFGTNIVNISAERRLNHTSVSLSPGTSNLRVPTINFCNVSVTYEHPGWGDIIHVSVWLPVQDWNGRLQALGGGGYSATFGSLYLTQAVDAGYVAIDTDAGLGGGIDKAQDPSGWALTSTGNINLYNLENFGSRSLEAMTLIGKSITKAYYGVAPKYSYFSGCSGGGRQGLMIAQRFSHLYDGILAVTPAINIQRFIPAGYWATQVMNDIEYYPPSCEIDAFTKEAIAACDALDGLEDGVIGSPHLCNFTAQDVVGTPFVCDDKTLQLTPEGAKIVQAAWTGPRLPSGRLGWFGLSKDASLTSSYLKTQCATNSTTNCTAVSTELLSSWIKYFLAKDPRWNASKMTNAQYHGYLRYSEQNYASMLGASSPDLSLFKAAGGKMITWHGGADEVIPPQGNIAYYKQVLALDPDAPDYYRFFEAPGVGHCIGGQGPIPNGAFEALVQWVEANVAPDTSTAVSQGGSMPSRPLCPYPLRQIYVPDKESDGAFQCLDTATDEGGHSTDQQTLANFAYH